MSGKALLTVLTATTILATGVALAAQDSSTMSRPAPPMPGRRAAVTDFGKLSADGTRAFQDLTLTRLAIFDGRIDEAKKDVADANSEFSKAKNDDSVFTKAEADLKPVGTPAKATAQGSPIMSGSNSGATTKTASGGTAPTAQPNGSQDASKPIAWLPVDGTVSLNEDYTSQPAKAKAVADANQSLAKGDRKGAMDKLRLADVDVSIVLAVVPLNQTVTDVQQAAQLIDSGKYYEGSQKLRAVQDSAIVTVADMPAKPIVQKGNQQQMAPAQKPVTH